MRLSYQLALAALLGGASVGLAQSPASAPPSAVGAHADCSAPAAPMSVNGQQGTADGGYWGGGKCYFGIEYLLWKMRAEPLPSLNATVPVTFAFTTQDIVGNPPVTITTPHTLSGVISAAPILATTQLGSDDLTRSGARFSLGYWCTESCAVELNYFQLEQRNVLISASGQNIFNIPTQFTDTVPGGTGSNGTTLPPITTTHVLQLQINANSIGTEQTRLWGVEFNGRDRFFVIGDLSVDFLFGIRYIDLEDIIKNAERLALTSPPASQSIFLGGSSTVSFDDSVATRNQFLGGEVGLSAQYVCGSWFFEGGLKGGIGPIVEQIKISEGFAQVPPPPAGTLPAAGLVLPQNNGSQSRTQLTLMGEWNLKAGYQFTSYFKGFVGYDFLYIKEAIRAGSQFGQSGNTASTTTSTSSGSTQVSSGTAVRSAAVFNDDKFYAHGLTVGLEFMW